MDIFRTNIPDAIRKGILEEGAFICQKNGNLKKLGSFQQKVFQRLSPENQRKFFDVDYAKTREAVAKYVGKSPEKNETLQTNIQYFSKIGRWSSAPLKEELRDRFRKASQEFFGG